MLKFLKARKRLSNDKHFTSLVEELRLNKSEETKEIETTTTVKEIRNLYNNYGWVVGTSQALTSGRAVTKAANPKAQRLFAAGSIFGGVSALGVVMSIFIFSPSLKLTHINIALNIASGALYWLGKNENRVAYKTEAERLCIEAQKEMDLSEEDIVKEKHQNVKELIRKIRQDIQENKMDSLHSLVEDLKTLMKDIKVSKPLVDNDPMSNLNNLNNF